MKSVKKPLHGVNLGGWLVLERWMTPSLFKGSEATDELALTREKGESYILKCRKQFITEADFKWLKKNKVEAIRVPVGYWILESQDDYAASPEVLDWCFEMADKYDLKVLLGLHAAPGAQNKADHGGNGLGERPRWFKRQNRIKTTKVLLQLAERYGQHPSLWGISLLNEPVSLGLIRYLRLRAWTNKTTKLLRKVLPDSIKIVFSDAYLFRLWYKVQPSETLDIHHYQCHSKRDKQMTKASAHLSKLGRIWCSRRHKLGSRPYIVGEWSAVLPSSVNSTSAVKQLYISNQIESFKGAEAIFYWSYKTEHEGGWSYRSMVEKGFDFRG